MKIVPIFVSENVEGGLWSIQLPGAFPNEFIRFFRQVRDRSLLRTFFKEHHDDLMRGFFGHPSINEAIAKTLEDAKVMAYLLQHYTNHYLPGIYHSLQMIFKPLNNLEYTISLHQKSKARTRKGWLRIYAIRIAPNCYIMTGGAIKLTQHMKRDHLQQELYKFERTKQFLRANGINYPEDLNSFYYE